MSEKKNIFITRGTQHRLVADIKEIIRNPLTEHGIYYAHDETDMLKGYALIIGPSETIYSDGFYLFEFFFPPTYPFSPPELKFRTTDGQTRFHPNLYRNGKVCLSILNTWKGEQWTSCQTVRSILLTLITLFHNKPLLNEPGFTEKSKDFCPYNITIKYRNYKGSILGIVNQQHLPALFIPFYTFIKKHFLKEYENIKKRLEDEIKKEKKRGSLQEIFVAVYQLRTIPNYERLLNDLSTTFETLNKLK